MSVPAAYRHAYLMWRQTPMPPEDGTAARAALEQLCTDLIGRAACVEPGRHLDYKTLAGDGSEKLSAVEQAAERDVPESGRAAYDTYLSATRSWLRELARLGALVDPAHTRREMVALGVTCIVFAVALLWPPTGLEQAVWAALAAMFGTLAWKNVFFPGALFYAITIEEEGFLFMGPFRRQRFIRWSSITKVVASVLYKGDWDVTAITLHIRSADGHAWVPDRLTPFYAILEQLKRMDGFDHAAWKSAHVLEDELIRGVIPKRTVIYRGVAGALRSDRAIDTMEGVV